MAGRFGEQLAPYLESRIAQKLDRDEVADMLKAMLDGAVMLKATTVTVENKTTGVSHNLGLRRRRSLTYSIWSRRA